MLNLETALIWRKSDESIFGGKSCLKCFFFLLLCDISCFVTDFRINLFRPFFKVIRIVERNVRRPLLIMSKVLTSNQSKNSKSAKLRSLSATKPKSAETRVERRVSSSTGKKLPPIGNLSNKPIKPSPIPVQNVRNLP